MGEGDSRRGSMGEGGSRRGSMGVRVVAGAAEKLGLELILR